MIRDYVVRTLWWGMAGALSVMALFFGTHASISISRSVWIGIAIALLCTAGVVGGVVWYRSRKARKAKSATNEADVQALEMEAVQHARGIETLRSQWKAAIQFLKRSGLKKRGNPLYVLPWYLVMGDSGSGKTSVLRDAGVPTFAERTGSAELSATAHCEWSFFENAIVVDTAGRYTSWVDPKQDKAEWNYLQSLLLKVRRREPLNGLILTIAANECLDKSAESLRSYGQTLRKRLDELMRAMGARFPIYLVVTKCDSIDGIAALGGNLTETGLKQAMGYLNEESATDATAFLDKAFSRIGERLKSLRLVIAGRPTADSTSASLLRLPEALLKLRVGVAAFLEGAFQENVYQETPLLRGLFLTSAARVGSEAAPRGWFLHDLFTKILPADRSLAVPTRRALSWRRKNMGLGALCWISVVSIACLLMSVSFVKNLNELRDMEQEFSHLPTHHSDMVASILAMDRLNETIVELQQKSASGWSSVFGLHEVTRVETALQEQLSDEFRRDIQASADDYFSTAMTGLTAASPDDHYSRWIGHVVARLSLLRAKLDGADRESLLQMPPPPIPTLRVMDHEADPDIKDKYARLYVNAVAWSTDTPGLQAEVTSLQTQLQHLLKLKSGDPQWVIAWAATQDSIPPVTLKDFWGGDAISTREATVPGLFSLKGKAVVDAFFHEIDGALGDSVSSHDLKASFDHWYRLKEFDAWKQFVIAFHTGSERLHSENQWQQAAAQMPTDKGAYFALLHRVADEFAPIPVADLPVWLQHVEQLRDLRDAQAFWNYRQQLEKVAKVTPDPVQAVTQAFSEQSQPGSSPFSIGFDSLSHLKTTLPTEITSDPTVWSVVAGPMNFLWAYSLRETAHQLQSDWESKVLANATGLSGAQAMPVLLSKDGPVMTFSKGQAAPFIQWKSGQGYGPKWVYGEALPFTSEYFRFLNGAVWVSSVNELHVAFTALDPETNSSANTIPHVTRLTLTCDGKTQTLSNRRLRVLEKSFNVVQQQFSWTPACTDTALEMTIGDATLRKTYPGSYGFLSFLHDFKTGKHAYSRNEFPDQSKSLMDMGVSWIAMHYRIQGAPDFAAPAAAPAHIVDVPNE